MKIGFLTPTYKGPHPAFLKALEDSCPILDAAGIEHLAAFEQGSPYISWARANLLHKALQTDVGYFIFLDDDVSWTPPDMLKLVETTDDVVMGTYRFKQDTEDYMGAWHCDSQHRPITRLKDRAIQAHMYPAGFLKLSRDCVRTLMMNYPELIFGVPEKPAFDLFNHGAHVIGREDFRWWGEDYAFAHRWGKLGKKAWLVPDLNLDHWEKDICYKGNIHEHLLRQPGGSMENVTSFRSIA